MIYKQVLLLLSLVHLTTFQFGFWYNQESTGDWEVSNKLRRQSDFYGTYKHIDRQMDNYGFATHVGKINRGDLRNPELNSPKDRAYGVNADFNPQDRNTDDFEFNPGCQWTLATKYDVDLGFATCVGDTFCLPNGLEVQDDSSLVIETKNKAACSPNPCRKYKITSCQVEEDYKARCVPKRAGNIELVLKWTDREDDYSNNGANNVDLYVEVFAKSDPYDAFDVYETDHIDILEPGDPENYGVVPDADYVLSSFYDYEYLDSFGEEIFLLTTLADGTTYTNYNYMVMAYHNTDYPEYSEAVLTVKHDGQVVQRVAVPQFITNIGDFGGNPSPDTNADTYIFGCLKNGPDGYYLDTSRRGFVAYNTVDEKLYYNWCNFDMCET